MTFTQQATGLTLAELIFLLSPLVPLVALFLAYTPALAPLWVSNWYWREAIAATIPLTSLTILVLALDWPWLHRLWESLGDFALLAVAFLVGPFYCLLVGISLTPRFGPRWLRRLMQVSSIDGIPDLEVATRNVTLRSADGTITLQVPRIWNRSLLPEPSSLMRATCPSAFGGRLSTLAITEGAPMIVGELIHQAPTAVDGIPAEHLVGVASDGPRPTATHQWILQGGLTVTVVHPLTDTAWMQQLAERLVATVKVDLTIPEDSL